MRVLLTGSSIIPFSFNIFVTSCVNTKLFHSLGCHSSHRPYSRPSSPPAAEQQYLLLQEHHRSSATGLRSLSLIGYEQWFSDEGKGAHARLADLI
ncbi:hypothetical protein CPC08DRAFT_120199 [Agrocybe pediades]|nr:hypothetical protein CPC08DRAFT_120199 [Agrocybe pediades]